MDNEYLKTELTHLIRRLENLEHAVFGNGRKGIKDELIELKTEIQTCSMANRSRRCNTGHACKNLLLIVLGIKNYIRSILI